MPNIFSTETDMYGSVSLKWGEGFATALGGRTGRAQNQFHRGMAGHIGGHWGVLGCSGVFWGLLGSHIGVFRGLLGLILGSSGDHTL
jgi:hypothetical protein